MLKGWHDAAVIKFHPSTIIKEILTFIDTHAFFVFCFTNSYEAVEVSSIQSSTMAQDRV